MQLDPIHDRAIDLFAAGKRAGEVARELNVSLRTLRRWNSDPDFSAELQTQRNGARTIAQTQSAIAFQEKAALMHAATEEAFKLLKSEDPQMKIRVLAVINQMMMQERRLESSEEWRRFVYLDKIDRAEFARELEREDDEPPAAAESGQIRPKAATEPQPAQNPPATAAVSPAPAAAEAPQSTPDAPPPAANAEHVVPVPASNAAESVAAAKKSSPPPRRAHVPFYARVARGK